METKMRQSEAARPELETLLNRARQIKEHLDAAKPLYDELDAIALRVRELAGVEVEIPIPGGYGVAKLVDNFDAVNTVFRPVGVKRFELKIMTCEELAYSKMSKSEKTAYNKAKKGNGGGE